MDAKPAPAHQKGAGGLRAGAGEQQDAAGKLERAAGQRLGQPVRQQGCQPGGAQHGEHRRKKDDEPADLQQGGAASLHGFRQQGRKNGLLPARRPQGGRGSGAGQEKARQQGGKRMQAVEDQPTAHVSEHGSSDETGKKARPGIVAEAQGTLGLCL